jgi:hypothetical protein
VLPLVLDDLLLVFAEVLLVFDELLLGLDELLHPAATNNMLTAATSNLFLLNMPSPP